MNSVHPILAKNLSALHTHGIKHGFFTRQDSVSKSLNVGQSPNNQPEYIAQNHIFIADYFGVKVQNLVTVNQIHSCEVVVVDQAFIDELPKADALVTTTPGLVIGILTADCGPVLFSDPQAGVIAATHAGWRGSLKGIIAKTIAAMEEQGAKRHSITAALGPCIGPCHYEVTDEFYNQFIDCNNEFQKYFLKTEKVNHFHFNLWAFIMNQLKEAGINAFCVELCTYQDEQRFFSYRRAIHRNEPDYGRQFSAIVLNK
ncbi:polyphenol oxidase [Bartonella henselae]|uniref:Purine nucleoside phosphorylase n=1 Tax=Bartonella henselae TaxID=38323 RepID=X5MHX9_BARHN|nr:peptidoglycan editing factor PgeF [Bartonella henselae]MDM9996852.1 peptidoglycan editing factor PgeF [Bartonella henselae]OLL47390.1 polyphenol oxidase [Bartonella henselae]OLL48964.1 polyphenol oxidase [Bartonella henselae]OLL49562.1 polyphenol oxidase [Bartonella henselae]OLL58582.1 polyphenol oxidase [Bartonella henselae]